MSTITEFSVGCSKTINLGNYQTTRVEASITVEMVPGENEVISKAETQLRRLVEDTLKAQPHSELVVLLHEIHLARAQARHNERMKEMENEQRNTETPAEPSGYPPS